MKGKWGKKPEERFAAHEFFTIFAVWFTQRLRMETNED
jgi:hypothetical protein